MHIRDRLPNVPFDHKLDTCFSLLILSAVVDGPQITYVTGEQDIFPCPYLCFYLYLYLSPFNRKGKLVRSLVPLVALTSGSRSSSHVSARRAVTSNLVASKTVTSSRATHEESVSFYSSSSWSGASSPSSLPGSTGSMCGLDRRLRIHPCLHQSNDRR